MSKNPPEGMPRISPMLWYRDVAAALDWLSKSFGFVTKMSLPAPDGGIMHAEMQLEDGLIMLGPESPEREVSSPLALSAVNQSLYVYVDEVDEHCARARAAGARITEEPTEMFWGDRIYSVQDCEGHHWTFAEKVREVSPEELTPPAG